MSRMYEKEKRDTTIKMILCLHYGHVFTPLSLSARINEATIDMAYRLSGRTKMNGHTNGKAALPLPKGVPFNDYQPPNWDEFFMLKVYLTGENGDERCR
jgi:hypothetical protein